MTGNLYTRSVTIVTDSVNLTWSGAGFIHESLSSSVAPPTFRHTNGLSFPHSFSQLECFSITYFCKLVIKNKNKPIGLFSNSIKHRRWKLFSLTWHLNCGTCGWRWRDLNICQCSCSHIYIYNINRTHALIPSRKYVCLQCFFWKWEFFLYNTVDAEHFRHGAGRSQTLHDKSHIHVQCPSFIAIVSQKKKIMFFISYKYQSVQFMFQ